MKHTKQALILLALVFLAPAMPVAQGEEVDSAKPEVARANKAAQRAWENAPDTHSRIASIHFGK